MQMTRLLPLVLVTQLPHCHVRFRQRREIRIVVRALPLHHRRPSQLLRGVDDRRVYFVNSYRATPSEANSDWTLATSSYGGGDFVAAVGRGNVYATQFHPEKSGGAGLDILRNFLGPLDADVPEPVSRSSECRPPCSYLCMFLPDCCEMPC